MIPEYGRWDDLGCLLEIDKTKQSVLEYLKQQYTLDLDNLKNNKLENITLLGKWLWSENTSSEYTKKLARILINSKLFGSAKEYRQNLTKLRKAIGIVETKLTNKEYENIDYSKLPSLALLKYRNAFLNKDEERYRQYLEDVKNNKAKINTKTLYPYDIVKGYEYKGYGGLKQVDETLETQWKNLPDYVPEFNGLVVADTSGSMEGQPMDVSISLAVYIAERNKSEVWKNYCIPFSHQPYFIELTGNNLLEKIQQVYTGDCSNTDLQAVFNMILSRAKLNKVKNEDIPKTLIIISDMEFDANSNNTFLTNYEEIKRKYEESEYSLPRLIWWNVNSRNNQCPVKEGDKGSILLSGCSPTILKIALNPDLEMMGVLEEVINQDRYKFIKY